jgi:hypothetical protein
MEVLGEHFSQGSLQSCYYTRQRKAALNVSSPMEQTSEMNIKTAGPNLFV